MSAVLDLDGAASDGGGQALRTALALSLLSGTPFRLRRKRSKAGLSQAEVAAVQAATRIGSARVRGASVGSSELAFHPSAVKAGHYELRLAAAESATSILQTLLVPLLATGEPSTLILEGATHHPSAPPPEFLVQTFAPCLRAMHAGFELEVERAGLHPSGGGRLVATITPPAGALVPLQLFGRGEARSRDATVLVAGVAESVAQREVALLADRLGLHHGEAHEENLGAGVGSGNAILVTLAFDEISEVISGVGARGHSPESLVAAVCAEAAAYLASDAPVGIHLADQLIVPCAFAGGGTFRAVALTAATRTNADLVRDFLGVETTFMEESDGAVRIEIEAGRHRHR